MRRLPQNTTTGRMMTDGPGNDRSRRRVIREARILSSLALLFSVFFAHDLHEDWDRGASSLHLALELSVVILATGAAGWLWRQSARQHEYERRRLHLEVQALRDESERWRAEAGSLLAGLGAAIEQQFRRWSLTPAESEVGMLLLKGLSQKEIASVRAVSERTIREQCTSIYAKASVDGRSQFAAFFLEDLLLPLNADGSKPLS